MSKINSKIIVLVDKYNRASDKLDEIYREWENVSGKCRYNSRNWPDEKLIEHCVGLAGPCQHPKRPYPGRIGNCGPEYCPVKLNKDIIQSIN
jgi:hypothetical protein